MEETPRWILRMEAMNLMRTFILDVVLLSCGFTPYTLASHIKAEVGKTYCVADTEESDRKVRESTLQLPVGGIWAVLSAQGLYDRTCFKVVDIGTDRDYKIQLHSGEHKSVTGWIVNDAMDLHVIVDDDAFKKAKREGKIAPKTRQEFETLFRGVVKEMESRSSKGKGFINTKTFMVLAELVLSTCHTQEELYLLKFRLAQVSPEAIVTVPMACREGGESVMKAAFKIADAELAKKTSARSKLKPFFASWLAVIRSIPRPTLSERALKQLQEEERKILRQRLAELELELM
jgi:hypothetical protein